MCIRYVTLICTIMLIWFSAGPLYSEQEEITREVTAEQKEKAHAILKQALAITEKNAQKQDEFTLGAIAAVLASVDLDEALAVVDKISQASSIRGMALASILPEAAKTDKVRVMGIFDSIITVMDALKAGGGGEEWSGLFLAVVGIETAMMIGAVAKTDMDLALTLADKFKSDETYNILKWLSLVHIAGITAKTDMDRALAIASRIEDSEIKSMALIYISGEIAEKSKERAQAILDEALDIIDKQGTDVPFDDEMTGFIVAKGIAKVNPDKAIALATKIKDSSPMGQEKARVMTQIVTEIAKTDPSKSLDIARKEPYPSKAQMLVRIGTVIAKTDPDKALAIADEIDKMKYIEANLKAQRSEVIAAAAAEIAKSDKQRGMALLEQAWIVADMPKYSGERHALSVASMTAQVDADMAIKMAEKIENPAQRGMILSNVATTIARTDPDKAILIAEKMEENALKAQTLCNIAAAIL